MTDRQKSPTPEPGYEGVQEQAPQWGNAQHSYWGRAFARLRRNVPAMVGGVFACLLVFVVLLVMVCDGFNWANEKMGSPLNLQARITPYPYDEAHYGPEASYQPPSAKFWMGTDDLGRDLFSRLIYSLRNALIISLAGTALSLFVGGTLGATAGYCGGKVDFVIMRITDVFFAFPTFLFCIVLVAAMGRGFLTMFIAVGITSWVGMARLLRGQVIAIKNLEYVELARALGANGFRVITRYILPNTLGPIIVSVTLSLPVGMTVESGLSFLGMGVQPPIPSFGTLIMEGGISMRAYPHLLIFPATLFAVMLLAFTFLGDGLQNALIITREGE